MIKSKRLIAGALTAALTLTAAACGGDDGGGDLTLGVAFDTGGRGDGTDGSDGWQACLGRFATALCAAKSCSAATLEAPRPALAASVQ